METIKLENKVKLLCDSEKLSVIRIDNRISNLALTTLVWLDTNSNKTTVKYSVTPWSDNQVFKFIKKEFKNYLEAIKYYNKIVEKYSNTITKEVLMDGGI